MANTITTDELTRMMDEYAATGKSTITPSARPSNAGDPQAAIRSVAERYGINPDYIIGLAKLETQSGSRTVAGTNNLFNIKDFSGKGTAAYDKTEKSNDKYRKYESYEQSVEDLIKLFQRRYPGALDAKTPEEFAKSLKGYATDPEHGNKLVKVIGKPSHASGSSGRSNITTDELTKMMDDYVASKQPASSDTTSSNDTSSGYFEPNKGEPKSGTVNPTSGRYFAPVDQSKTSLALFDKSKFNLPTPLKVAASGAAHAFSAGFLPENATLAEREEYPMASALGSLAGSTPYAFVPGGIPVKMAVMGGRAALQAANEGKSPGQIATAGAIDALSMGGGALAGKLVNVGTKYGSKYIGGKIAPNVTTSVKKFTPPEQEAVIKVAEGGLGSAVTHDVEPLVSAVSKTIPANRMTEELASNITKMAKTVVDNPINALPLNVKINLFNTALNSLPNISQAAYRQSLKRLPFTEENQTAYLASMIGKLADDKVSPEVFDAAIRKALITYNKSLKFSANTPDTLGKVAGRTANVGTTSLFQLGGRSAINRSGE